MRHYWDHAALRYDDQDFFRKIAEKLVALAAISKGLKVLDIGSGNNDTVPL